MGVTWVNMCVIKINRFSCKHLIQQVVINFSLRKSIFIYKKMHITQKAVFTNPI